MTEPWVLVLEAPTGDPRRLVAGLSLALRLVLEAQRAGASGIVMGRGGVTDDDLADPRVRIPLSNVAGDGVRAIGIASDTVVHRVWLARRASRSDSPRDAYEFDPIAVVDHSTARAAERALFRSLRKPQDGWTSRYLNRHISLAISRWLVRTPLRPNQVSVAILAVGLAGAWLATHGRYETTLVGALLFQAQSVLDGCDGEMSRITFRGSLLGEWLDTVGDDLTNYGFFTGAAWGMYSTTGWIGYAAAGGVIVACGVIASGIEYRYLVKIGSGDLLRYPITVDDGKPAGAFSKLTPLTKRDTFVLLTLIAAAAGLVGPMLVVFAIGALGIFIAVVRAELRMARERADVSPTRGTG